MNQAIEEQKVRRSQIERSESTKARLLEATLEVICERGWSGTSTAKICERAGVSRGAQTHHYPTKADLLVAAVRKNTARFDALFAANFPDTASDETPLRQYVEMLWSACLDRAFLESWIEAMVAARTDLELRPSVEAVDRAAIKAMRAAGSAAYADERPRQIAADLVELTVYLLRGMAVQRGVHSNETERRRLFEVWSAILEQQIDQ